MTAADVAPGLELVERLCDAVSHRDLGALVACFSPDYINETPAHPARGFAGSDQVRANWERLFSGLTNLAATVLDAVCVDQPGGEVVWSEWRIEGRRSDGQNQELRGVIVFEVTGGLFTRARFYLEPLDSGGEDVAAAVGRMVKT